MKKSYKILPGFLHPANKNEIQYGVDDYIKKAGLSNANVMHAPGGPIILGEGENSPYVMSIYKNDIVYDAVAIDGVHRNTCVKHAVQKVKNGGMIIFDNFQSKKHRRLM